MFDIGFWELSLIAVIALLILGPERLPRAARQAGLWAGKVRKMVSEVKSNINEELRMEELNALKKAARQLGIDVPLLADYRVRIPPSGRTHALVETTITWRFEKAGSSGRKQPGETFSTLGVDSDQLAAAIIATEKMLNAVVTRRDGGRSRTRRSRAATTRSGRGTKPRRRASD